ncbi:MAG: outer membrane beta-barrel protein [Pseudomonadota bacterium]
MRVVRHSLIVAAVLAAPSLVSAQDFEGPYIGLQFGTADVDSTVGAEGDDTILGIHAGMTFAAGQYIYGGEIDYDQFDLSLSADAGDVDSVTRLKARGGVDLGGTLLYGTTGVAFVSTSDLGDETGYFLGLGAEFALPAPGRVGVEYLYHEFNDWDALDTLEVDASTLSLRYSYNF